MTKPLTDKIAVVTGGSRGIGAAIAARLARDGATIVLVYAQNSAAAQGVVARVREEGGEAVALQADMGDPAAIESMCASVGAKFGRIDILVNNAATSGGRPIEATEAAFIDHMLGVNVRGPLLAIRAALPLFKAEGGRIVNISSSITRAPTAEWSVYAASKSALEMLSACLAMELGPRHITVNVVAPGITATDMLNQTIPADVQQQMVQSTALRRLGQPDDIADVVAFLCGPDGRWVTAHTLIANGGLR